MSEGVRAALPWAIGVLASPTAMVAVILLLMTPRAAANASALIMGWLISLSVVATIAYVAVTALGMGGVRRHAHDQQLDLVLGGLLLLMAVVVLWRTRRRRKRSAGMPRWLRAVDSFTPGRSFAVGLAVGDVKNFILAVAAVSAVVASGRQAEPLWSLILFVVVGSLGVLLPTGVYVFRRDRAEPMLTRWRDWLVAHNAVIVAIVLLAFGLALVMRGLGVSL